MKTRVKTFQGYENGEEECNKFLDNIGELALSVTPVYNAIMGGVDLVVVYNTNKPLDEEI